MSPRKRKPYPRKRGPLPRGTDGLTTRERNELMGLRGEGKTRGFRALRAACERLGIHPLDVRQLRGAASRAFHAAWTAEMKHLARTDGGPFPWDDAWDTKRYGPVYEFHRTPISQGEKERHREHETRAA